MSKYQMNTSTSVELGDKHFHIVQKNVDEFIMCDILKSIRSRFLVADRGNAHYILHNNRSDDCGRRTDRYF
jgi:hypothetical protein